MRTVEGTAKTIAADIQRLKLRPDARVVAIIADANDDVDLYRITPEEAGDFEKIRAAVQEGIADLEAGRVHTSDEVRAMLGIQEQ